MRLAVLLIGGLLAGAGVGGCAATRAERGPSEVLDAWHGAAAAGDFDAYFGAMTEDAVFIGTDAGERWSRSEFEDYARPYFGRPAGAGSDSDYLAAWVYEPRDRRVIESADGDVAWFDELLDNASYGTARGTGVLVLDGGAWRVAHYHLTFPVPNDLAREVTGMIQRHEASGEAAAGANN